MKVTLNVSPFTELDHKITIYGITKSTESAAAIHVRKLISDTAGNKLEIQKMGSGTYTCTT